MRKYSEAYWVHNYLPCQGVLWLRIMRDGLDTSSCKVDHGADINSGD